MAERELTREEKAAIRKLVTSLCANYDRKYGCLPLGGPCYMLDKCWTGACCRYFRESVLFDNGRGFALGENDRAPAPFVTWQFAEENGHRDYYWGHYHTNEAAANKDFAARSADYQRRYGVQEVKRPIAEQMKAAKEQTEKPADKVREMPPKAKSREREER